MHYFGEYLDGSSPGPYLDVAHPKLDLGRVRLTGAISLNVKGSRPTFSITGPVPTRTVQYDHTCVAGAEAPLFAKSALHHDLMCNTLIEGDCKFQFYDTNTQGKKLFHFWLHTAFIKGDSLVLPKAQIDKALKDKHCETYLSTFQVELYFGPNARQLRQEEALSPEAAAPAPQKQKLATLVVWDARTDPATQHPYWYCALTNVSSWYRPLDLGDPRTAFSTIPPSQEVPGGGSKSASRRGSATVPTCSVMDCENPQDENSELCLLHKQLAGKHAKEKEKSGFSFTRMARGLVSKKKERYQEDGFDLDLTYITPRIIAMGFPSEGKDALYRNPLSEVQQFFAKYHQDAFKVYNLCSEKQYDKSLFAGCGGTCAGYPFDDHNAPPFQMMHRICDDMKAYLDADPKNIVALHCKAGKGRTGTLIAAYLAYTGACASAASALELFGAVRTKNGKVCVDVFLLLFCIFCLCRVSCYFVVI